MRVVPIEINVENEFSRRNLKELGYEDIVVVLDGSEGYTTKETYDEICVTASCPYIPELPVGDLRPGGWIIACIGPQITPESNASGKGRNT